MARTGGLALLCLLALANANLWNTVNQQALVHSLNDLRQTLQAAHKTMTYSSDLASKADAWTATCTGTSDPKLRHLYGVVFVNSAKTLSTTEFLDVFNSEASTFQRFNSREFDRARNYTVLTGVNATEIGCAMNKCGTKYFYGCLVSPKSDFPGKVPYVPSCKASKPVDCANHSFCGSYFDGCKMVDCGPSCPTPGQDRSSLTYEEMLPRVLKRDGAATVDWRTKGVVTPVKDQGQCGSCWAHSSVELIESQWAIRNGKLLTLSVQQMLSCSRAGSCGGGDPGQAVAWPSDKNAMMEESSFPYTGQDSGCSSAAKSPVIGTSSSRKSVANTEAAIEAALSYGPVGIGFRVENPFYNYRSGIFTTPCQSRGGNHAVVIEGYGTENGQDYWIMRNSWGTSWGEDGYARVPKGINWCGIADYNYQFNAGQDANPVPLPPPSPPVPVPTPTPPAPSPWSPPVNPPPYTPPTPTPPTPNPNQPGPCAQFCQMGGQMCDLCCQYIDDPASCGGSPPPSPPPPTPPAPTPAPVPPPTPPPVVPPPASQEGTLDTYNGDDILSEGEQLWDQTGTVFLVMQGDGNLVVYNNPPTPQTAIWSTQTSGGTANPYRFALQSDGNCVIYGSQGYIWASGTNGLGTAPYVLTLDSIGRLTLTDSTGSTLWNNLAPAPPSPTPAPTPPSPTPTPAPAPVPTPPTQDTGSLVTPSQMNEIMTVHNNERSLVGVSNIEWDPTIAAWAQTWSDKCVFQHSQRSGYGENIAMGSQGYSATALTQMWADEKQGYSCTQCCSGNTGHYTQMVWQQSTKVGCGMTMCNQMGGWFLVCQYSPQGNYIGQTPYPC